MDYSKGGTTTTSATQPKSNGYVRRKPAMDFPGGVSSAKIDNASTTQQPFNKVGMSMNSMKAERTVRNAPSNGP